MAGEINRVPAGLLALLDMKARGQNPRELAPQLLGTVELLDLYLSQNRRTDSGAVSSAISPTNVTTFTVPQDQLWYAYGIGISSSVAVSAHGVVATVLRNTLGGSVVVHRLGAPHAFLAGDAVSAGWPGPFLFQPGDKIGISHFRTSAVLSCSLSIDYTPLAI